MIDEVFEVYVRDADGRTEHMPLREGLKQFLDIDKGYRLTINIEGVKIVLRNEWDDTIMDKYDEVLGTKSIKAKVTVHNL